MALQPNGWVWGFELGALRSTGTNECSKRGAYLGVRSGCVYHIYIYIFMEACACLCFRTWNVGISQMKAPSPADFNVHGS